MKKQVSEVQTVNRLIAILYATVTLVIILSYALEVKSGARTVGYYIALLAIMVVPGAINLYIQVKAPDSKVSKLILMAGYLGMYIYVMFSTTAAIYFTYILPFMLVFMLTHEFRTMLMLNITVFVINVVHVVYNLAYVGRGSDLEYVKNLKIQLAIIFLFCLFTIISSYLDSKINTKKINEIHSQSEKNQTILSEVLAVVKDMNSSITSINELVVVLTDSCSKSAFAMKEVCAGTATTADNIQHQIEMTSEIQNEIDIIKKLSSDFKEVSVTTGKISNTGMKYIDGLMISVDKNNESTKLTIRNVDELQEKVDKINSFLEIISGISSRTKLLALNASIVAARAGEHGRGFAVVADEIRKLAQGTEESVHETQGIVNAITQHTKSVSESIVTLVEGFSEQNGLIGSTNETLSAIHEKVNVIETQTTDLEKKVNMLHKSNVAIVDSIQNISAVSEETTANSSQTEELSTKSMNYAEQINKITTVLTALSTKLDKICATM